jgi:tetratricopeptide (TPR) repeat protein
VYAARGQDRRAEDSYQRSIRILRATETREEAGLAVALVRLALLRKEQKRLDEAHLLFEEALEIDRNSLGKEHPYYGQHLIEYAALLRKMKRNQEAEVVERQARSILEANRSRSLVGQTVDIRTLKGR